MMVLWRELMHLKYRFKRVQIIIAYNRCLYRMSDSRFRFDSYKDLNDDIFYRHSPNGELYICLMCDRILKKNVYAM